MDHLPAAAPTTAAASAASSVDDEAFKRHSRTGFEAYGYFVAYPDGPYTHLTSPPSTSGAAAVPAARAPRSARHAPLCLPLPRHPHALLDARLPDPAAARRGLQHRLAQRPGHPHPPRHYLSVVSRIKAHVDRIAAERGLEFDDAVEAVAEICPQVTRLYPYIRSLNPSARSNSRTDSAASAAAAAAPDAAGGAAAITRPNPREQNPGRFDRRPCRRCRRHRRRAVGDTSFGRVLSHRRRRGHRLTRARIRRPAVPLENLMQKLIGIFCDMLDYFVVNLVPERGAII
ncbi:hypothetical protein HK405_005486 [Cladochytrium tenue]|nr:hypothetical protein HK405_005486 [Cladochytrium tenue]